MKILFYVVVVCIFISCGRTGNEVDSQEKNKESFGRLKDFLGKETRLNADSGNLFLFVIRRYDCSCNDKNLVYDRAILGAVRKSFRKLVIFIDEKDSDYTKKLKIRDELVYNDTARLLEKYGNLFIADKLFVVTNGEFTAMFDLEVDNRKKIDNFLKGINR